MEEVIRSVQLLLVICGGVITIGGAYKVFQDWQKPNKDLKAMVIRHDELLKQGNDRIKNIEKLVISQEGLSNKLNEHTRILSEHDNRLDEDKERSNLLLKANIAILNGLLSDSDKEKLVETRNEIQDFLVEKN